MGKFAIVGEYELCFASHGVHESVDTLFHLASRATGHVVVGSFLRDKRPKFEPAEWMDWDWHVAANRGRIAGKEAGVDEGEDKARSGGKVDRFPGLPENSRLDKRILGKVGKLQLQTD